MAGRTAFLHSLCGFLGAPSCGSSGTLACLAPAAREHEEGRMSCGSTPRLPRYAALWPPTNSMEPFTGGFAGGPANRRLSLARCRLWLAGRFVSRLFADVCREGRPRPSAWHAPWRRLGREMRCGSLRRMGGGRPPVVQELEPQRSGPRSGRLGLYTAGLVAKSLRCPRDAVSPPVSLFALMESKAAK